MGGSKLIMISFYSLKVYQNWFCEKITFKNPIKPSFSTGKSLPFYLCRAYLNSNKEFRKTSLIELLKIIERNIDTVLWRNTRKIFLESTWHKIFKRTFEHICKYCVRKYTVQCLNSFRGQTKVILKIRIYRILILCV